jgi:hypothetical protein
VAEVTDRSSLGPRVRHFLGDGDRGGEAAVLEYLEAMVERLFEVSDAPGDLGDELFELALVLSTLREALASDGGTALQLVIKKRPYTPSGGRHPDSLDLIWRKHEAARIAEASPLPNKEERIGEALATMGRRKRATGLTFYGIDAILTERRREREVRRRRTAKKTP